MSLICTFISSLYHPYVLVCTRMSSVCHSYVILPWTFQTIRFSAGWEYSCVGKFFKTSSFVKVFFILCNPGSVGYISMLPIQFHWQLLISSYGFRLVNIYFVAEIWYFMREMKMIKTNFLIKRKNKKRCHKSICKHKVAFFTLNLPTHSVIALIIEA